MQSGLDKLKRIVKLVVVISQGLLACVCVRVGGWYIHHYSKDEFYYSSLSLVHLECSRLFTHFFYNLVLGPTLGSLDCVLCISNYFAFDYLLNLFSVCFLYTTLVFHDCIIHLRLIRGFSIGVENMHARPFRPTTQKHGTEQTLYRAHA